MLGRMRNGMIFVGRMSWEDLCRQRFIALRPDQPAPGDREPIARWDGNSFLVVSRRALPRAG